MEYCKISKFSLHKNLFFDEINSSIFSINQDRLHVSGLHASINLSAYSKYLSRNLKKAALDAPREVLAVENKEKCLHLIGINTVCIKKLKAKSEILGFFFSTKTKVWDLCLVTETGIFTYKLEDELKPVIKSTTNISINSYLADISLNYLGVICGNLVVLHSLWGKKPSVLCKFEIGFNIAHGPGVQNLVDYIQPELDFKIITFGQFYDKVYLIVLDGFSGTLVLYKKETIKYSFNVDPGAYSLRVMNNMLILHNFGLQESIIIDRLYDPIMFKVSHRGYFELNPTFIQLNQRFSLDLSTQQLFELKISPVAWVESIDTTNNSIIFLLRRENSVPEGLNLLKSSILAEKSVDQVFKKIVKSEDNLPQITQSQVYSSVLLPCSKQTPPCKLLSNFILVYIKELNFSNISVELTIQVLMIKILIKSNELLLLQSLLSFHILDDSREIAGLLIELTKKQVFPFGYILGLDMLTRLRLSHLAMDEMLHNQDYFETMSLLNERPCPGYDLSKFNKETSDLYTNRMIQEFLRDNIY